jgi:hypothetical protein
VGILARLAAWVDAFAGTRLDGFWFARILVWGAFIAVCMSPWACAFALGRWG